MHEAGIIQTTLDLAEKQARTEGATCIHEVRLRVGRMAGVVPEALEFAFEALRAGTMAATATLKIDIVPAACWCHKCHAEFEAADLIGECTECGEPSAEIRRGMELELASLEVS